MTESATTEGEFQLYVATESDGKEHTLLKAPQNLDPKYTSKKDVLLGDDVFNIVMADVSGSMSSAWPRVVEGWSKHICYRLRGRTKIFVFESSVHFIRNGSELTNEDFKSGGTNITQALYELRMEVDKCLEAKVRVFVITDGDHVHGDPYPETEIVQMHPPQGKIVSVYLLGIGNGFPVNYSIDIRSNLHNGNANVPSLYWAKERDDIVEEMLAIGNDLNAALVELHLSRGAHILPGLDETSVMHLGEWFYFKESPKDLPPLKFSVNGEKFQEIPKNTKPISIKHLLDQVFRQWNSVLLQQHRKKAHVPRDAFDLMDSLFSCLINEMKTTFPQGNDVKSRLARKLLTSYEVEYRTLKNRGKNLIDVEAKFGDELELAENILKSTITNTKYSSRNLKLKGHGLDEFQEDMNLFQKVYKKCQPSIMALDPPLPEECCSITITSTLSDLQDSEFHLLFDENKFEFLKSFTMSGIPIFAPVRDSSQINPWTLVIKNILVTPYAILSQQVLEISAFIDETSLGSTDGDVVIQKDDEKTRFNAIIPVVPARAVEAMKPIILSNIYAMMATFAILKNPHIIDHNAHLAALGCAWMKMVKEFPVNNRPEFVRDRLANIEATASAYMNRPFVKRYVDVLREDPKQALMTESTLEFKGKTIKCESLVKPAFFIYMCRKKFTTKQVQHLLKLLVYEFLGRCVSSIRSTDTASSLYTEFFCEELANSEKRKTWLERHCKSFIDDFQSSQGNLLEKFYTLDDLIPRVKKHVSEEVSGVAVTLLEEVNIGPNMNKVKHLKNYASCGDIWWISFKNWALEMGLSDDAIQEIFHPKQIVIYLSECLKTNSSRDRLSKDLPEVESAYAGAYEEIKKKVHEENQRKIRGIIWEEVIEYSEREWREAYMKVHSPLVMPLTRQEVIDAAQARGIEVTMDSFDQVYRRYSAKLGLLRNACQIPGCPHYLQPHNNFNQHLSIEREKGEFPHSLHLASHEFHNQGIEGVIEEVMSGKHCGTKNRKVPSPPTSAALEPLTDQIERLLKVYSEQ